MQAEHAVRLAGVDPNVLGYNTAQGRSQEFKIRPPLFVKTISAFNHSAGLQREWSGFHQ
jgi:hypothetical protein